MSTNYCYKYTDSIWITRLTSLPRQLRNVLRKTMNAIVRQIQTCQSKESRHGRRHWSPVVSCEVEFAKSWQPFEVIEFPLKPIPSKGQFFHCGPGLHYSFRNLLQTSSRKIQSVSARFSLRRLWTTNIQNCHQLWALKLKGNNDGLFILLIEFTPRTFIIIWLHYCYRSVSLSSEKNPSWWALSWYSPRTDIQSVSENVMLKIGFLVENPKLYWLTEGFYTYRVILF